MEPKRIAPPIFLIFILLSSFTLKLVFVPSYPPYKDELTSAFTSKGIAETGIPRLPSGYLYDRGLLHLYLLAVPIKLFGLNLYSMRSLSIFFSLALTVLIYLFGREMSGVWIGLCAAFLFTMAQAENQLALSARHYMTFQFFCILAMYSFYKGFFENKRAYKIASILSTVAAVFSHRLSIFLICTLLLLLLVFYRKLRWFSDGYIWVGTLFVVAALYGVFVFDLPDEIWPHTRYAVPDMENAQEEQLFISLDMGALPLLQTVTFPLRTLDKIVPYSTPFVFLGMIWSLLKRRNGKLLFLYTAFAAPFVAHALILSRQHSRYVIYLAPLYLVILFDLLFAVSKRWRSLFRANLSELDHDPQLRGKVENALRKKALLTFALIGCYVVLLLPFVIENGALRPQLLFQKYRGAFGYQPNSPDLAPVYDFLKERVAADDIIVSTTLQYPYFYMGESYNYFYLMERAEKRNGQVSYSPFHMEREAYFGRGFIDSPEELSSLVSRNRGSTIWIVADWQWWAIGPEIKKLLESNFSLFYDDLQSGVRIYSTAAVPEQRS